MAIWAMESPRDTYLFEHPIAQWESVRPNSDLPKIEARSEVSA